MSRHRRQHSQVLPPEILTGDEDLGNSFDFSHITANQESNETGTTKATTKDAPTTTPPSPATIKKPPPAKST
ncbi:unnamed protein product [Lupinus luteus]|uniref:Uncharacterized protein n=1 Tax=Lupinus luteus TaxID=3873 RepID=A0AAV1X758_LUPLU